MIVKFLPGGVFEEDWAAFEAMERGVWLNTWTTSLGKQEIVAEFAMELPEDVEYDTMRIALQRYLSWQYDYLGIGIWAYWILLKRWAGSIVKWFNLVFRPKQARKALFCSGLLLEVVNLAKQMHPDSSLGMDGLEARTTTPDLLMEECFNHPKGWTWLGGSLTPDKFFEKP